MPELIVLEGGDACGKNTQSKILAEMLQTRVVAFPRYKASETGALITDLLMQRLLLGENGDSKNGDCVSDAKMRDARVLQALMTLDRYSCTDLWDAPEKALVLDRYWMSGAVYGALDGIPTEELLQIHRGLPQPKVAFLLDVPVDIQMQRLEGRGRVPDRYEAREGLKERLQTLRDSYLRVWKQHGPVRFSRTNWVIIDGSVSQAEVTARLKDFLPRNLI